MKKKFHGINEGREESWSVFSKYLSKKTFHNPHSITDLIKKRKLQNYR